jgi:hypothetical protein
LAVSGVVALLVLLAGARAWATVRKAEAGCQRPPVVATAPHHPGAVAGPRGTSPVQGVANHPRHSATGRASWRGKMLKAAGCQAWREIHSRHQHHQVGVSDTDVPSERRQLG